MNNPFEITREEILNLAAQKLIESQEDECSIRQIAEEIIEKKVDEIVSTELKAKVDEVLTREMERILNQEVVPVNIFGEREGNPTTIKAELAKRAKIFWNVKIDSNGKESSWGGEERCKVLFKQIVNDEFDKTVKQNAEIIVKEFKEAIKKDSIKLVSDHIDKLIYTK